MITKTLSSLVAFGLLACAASSASATAILAGGALVTPGEAGPTGGVLLSTLGPVAITSPTFTGTLTTTVTRNETTNPFGTASNFLTFTYVLHNNNTSAHNMERMTLGSFTGFSTDVSYSTPNTGVASYITDRSSTGEVIGFTFTAAPLGSGVLAPNATSAVLVVQTNSTVFTLSKAFVIDGSIASVDTYAPAPGAGTPEPASLSLVGLGAAGLLMRRRRTA